MDWNTQRIELNRELHKLVLLERSIIKKINYAISSKAGRNKIGEYQNKLLVVESQKLDIEVSMRSTSTSGSNA